MARDKLMASDFTNAPIGRFSPDDVLIERDQRRANDRRSPAQVWLGEPEYARSALAEYRQRQAEKHARPASGDSEASPLTLSAKPMPLTPGSGRRSPAHNGCGTSIIALIHQPAVRLLIKTAGG